MAVYGRLRVGKTFLIRTVYEHDLVFEFTGLKSAAPPEQLDNFSATLSDIFQLPVELAKPENWLHAFRQLIKVLTALKNGKKQVVFLDEFPWMDAPKSGFLNAFDHFWNAWASKQSDLVVVICGSAASWMIQNIVGNKGGLHNRITRRIRLLPFKLYEMELFLQNQHVRLDRYSILELFMVTGGIPQYLSSVKPGESVAQVVDRLCFTKDGALQKEFQFLYSALFDRADLHIGIVRALAAKPSGLTRNEIMQVCRLSSGGTLSNLIEELLESNFISAYFPFNKTVKDAIYKLVDEFSLFYLKFMENTKS